VGALSPAHLRGALYFPAIRPGLRRVSGLYATGIFTDLVTRVTRAAAFDLSIESARPNLVCLRPGETTA